MKLKLLRNIIIVVSLVILTFGSGYRLGEKNAGRSLQFSESESSKNLSGSTVDLTLFWDVWNRLNRYYIDKKALDRDKMIYGAISGMVSALGDPYTVFLPPTQNKEAKDDLGGKFEGIGVQLGVKDKKIVVIAPLKDSPSEKAGIKPGDIIVKVDGADASNWTLPEAVIKIRGPKGSTVALTIFHKDASASSEIKVVRDTITVKSVDLTFDNVRCGGGSCEVVKEVCDNCDRVAHLKLSRFGDDTSDEWNKAVNEIISAREDKDKRPFKGIIFDLRSNPGGYLSGSVFIASEFLKDGVVVTQDSITNGKETYTVERKGKLLDVPMIVLVNKGTASAGEIVAGALQDRGRSKLLGETTFGKGSVQEAQDLTGGAGIHITTAKWLLPSGRWINGTGVDPDIKVSNNESKPDEDMQLIKAIEQLEK